MKNVGLVDFGSDAADGLDNAWQNQSFGQNNPNAARTRDATGH